MKTPLTLAILPTLVGKVIEWNAEAYKHNKPYHGTERIIEIDLSKRKPIIKTEKIDSTSDDLIFAFVDDHGLARLAKGEGYSIENGNGSNNCLSFSDSFREIFYEIINEN